MRTCAKCLQSKDIEDFYFRNKKKNLRSSYCKLCFHEINGNYKRKTLTKTQIQQKREYEKNKDRYRDKLYQKNYGITLRQYNEMLEIQNNICRICFGVNENGRYLDVDHCHKTGKIRGLLCNSCNRLLSNAKDDTVLLESAIKYLKENSN